MTIQDDIRRYQAIGDRTIINKIMTAVEQRFMENWTRERVKGKSPSGDITISLKNPEDYIAYRIRAMRELIMKSVGKEEHVWASYEKDFQRLLSIIYIDFGIKFDAEIYDKDYYQYYFTLTADLFEQLKPQLKDIGERFEDMFNKSQRAHFESLFEQFYSSMMRSKEEKDARIAEVNQSAIKALEYALKYVDASKTDSEIVKYINQTFSSKLSDDEIKRNGLRRIRRKSGYGRTNSSIINPHFPENLYETILGVDYRGHADKLSKSQRDFMDAIMQIVLADFDSRETDNYTCNEEGELRISSKYIAEKMGVSYDGFRKKLSRIRKKVK
ncbi:hypothetical protein LIT25_21360 [Bacillus sp. F19]|nr:hypothetical protein LIT25_21360 [Bacillus sp. F19]